MKHIPIKYYQGKNGFIDVCERSVNKAKDEILFLGDITNVLKIYPVYYDNNYFIENRLKKNIRLRMITVRNKESLAIQAKDKGLLRETRFLKLKDEYAASYFIHTGEVNIIVNTNPCYGIVIENSEVYKSYVRIFEELWNNLDKESIG